MGARHGDLRENEMAILKTEKAMMRAMCGVKIIEKRSQELMSLLGLKEYFGWTSQYEWSAMVRACFEKG